MVIHTQEIIKSLWNNILIKNVYIPNKLHRNKAQAHHSVNYHFPKIGQ